MFSPFEYCFTVRNTNVCFIESKSMLYTCYTSITHWYDLGELNVNLVNEKGVNVPLQVNDNEDGSFLIDYVPTVPGVHNLNCTYGGVKVPQSPIKINVQSPVDLTKVKVDGLETRKFIRQKCQYDHYCYCIVYTITRVMFVSGKVIIVLWKSAWTNLKTSRV
jgi:hypothetical protein